MQAKKGLKATETKKVFCVFADEVVKSLPVYSLLLGPQQTAWSVHAPARMGLSRDVPRLASALAMLHVAEIVVSVWVAERTRE